MEGKEEMHPGQRHKEEAKPGATPALQDQGEEYVHQVPFVADTSRKERRKRRSGAGEASSEASCQLQANRFMDIPASAS